MSSCPRICWMKRMSAPFSCISVAIVWRKRWQAPVLPSFAASMRSLTVVGQMVAAERLALGREEHREVVRLDGKLGPRLGMYLLSHAIARSPMGT
jgi:hypothetical protein